MRSQLILTTFVVTLAGPPGSLATNFDEDTFERKSIPAYSIPTPQRGTLPAETVIGQVRPYRIRKGDTLIDLARYYDLGYNEIVDANPGIDPWVPPAGATILLPTQWVLPCCTYEGIVVNIPEMRLFFYRRAAGDPHTTIVYTYPVVPVGPPGEFLYQPVKVGVRGGAVYVETHRDIYGYAPAFYREATAAIARAGLDGRVDQNLLLAALEDEGGMPIRITPEENPPAQVLPIAADRKSVV